MTKQLTALVATGFYSGKFPFASGTAGTLAAIPFYLLLTRLGDVGYMVAVILISILGIVCADLYQKDKGGHDRSDIVIDEFAGFFVTMTWLPITWQAILAGFFLFRILDVVKPYPISILDKKVKGGFGVMIDDLAAGVVGNIILQIIYNNTTWLGASLGANS